MNKLSLSKGFTLIELLVVIAILGILAAVVLVAINPAERINEANDSNKKSIVGQAATAVEACYTANTGSYANCDTVAELVTGSYMKTTPNPAPDMLNTSTTAVRVSMQLQSASAACASGSGAYKAFVYRTSSGNSRIECAANYAGLAAP